MGSKVSKPSVGALALLAALSIAAGGGGQAMAQSIVTAPQVVGWGFTSCQTLLDNRRTDATLDFEAGQWAAGYYRGLLALDVEAAVPDFRGLSAWLTRHGSNADVVTPIGARIVAYCRAQPTQTIEVTAQLVAKDLAAEGRAGR